MSPMQPPNPRGAVKKKKKKERAQCIISEMGVDSMVSQGQVLSNLERVYVFVLPSESYTKKLWNLSFATVYYN